MVRSDTLGRSLWLRLCQYACVFALVFLLPLTDNVTGRSQAAYDRARQLFLHGYLERSQQQADLGYRQFRSLDPELATRFRLLEVEAMVWRGMYEDALRVLAERPPSNESPENILGRLTLEGVAYTGLQQFSTANQDLTEAAGLCAGVQTAGCGAVARARGVLALKRGQLAEARRFFLESQRFARQHADRWLEATALLNLGTVSLQEEHYDEALDWSRSAYRAAAELAGEDIMQSASGNQGWAYFGLGDFERALGLFLEAEKRATDLGDVRVQLNWLATAGYAYAETGKIPLARESYEQALQLARQIHSKEDISDILTDLALVEVASGNPGQGDAYASQALAMAQESGSRPDMMDAKAVQMQAAALRGDMPRATQLLQEVEIAPESQMSMKWASELAMARLYESQDKIAAARGEYQTALATFESARSELKHEESQLPFLANATRIYDDYIHFLVSQGKTEEALIAADQSRARTLAQGLGIGEGWGPSRTQSISPRGVARKAGATLLFYWLGEKQSYLWAITPEKTQLFTLPSESEINPPVERYRKALLGAEDPLKASNSSGAALYTMLVAPAAKSIRADKPVMILADGSLSELNFETLIVPDSGADGKAHYWIEDATLMSAPSLAMLGAAQPGRGGMPNAHGKLLLLGDPVSPDEDYPELPYASLEMREIEKHFAAGDEVVLSRRQATPRAYVDSKPQQFSYIHFVSHGVASRTDPLDSAIILSRAESRTATGSHASSEAIGVDAGQDSFKLYAREVMQHPIDARVVTISACYGSGTRAYAGEGLVGLSWAFLRAGAHSAIGALWEASDESSPRLMDEMYRGLELGQSPAAALRQAKLNLLHSTGSFRKPFYWAPFQMYTRM